MYNVVWIRELPTSFKHSTTYESSKKLVLRKRSRNVSIYAIKTVESLPDHIMIFFVHPSKSTLAAKKYASEFTEPTRL